jgi:hypothetical protein
MIGDLLLGGILGAILPFTLFPVVMLMCLCIAVFVIIPFLIIEKIFWTIKGKIKRNKDNE